MHKQKVLVFFFVQWSNIIYDGNDERYLPISKPDVQEDKHITTFYGLVFVFHLFL